MSEIYSPVFSDAFAFKSLCPRLQRAPSSQCRDAIETLCRGSQRRGPVSPNSCRRCGASPAESDLVRSQRTEL